MQKLNKLTEFDRSLNDVKTHEELEFLRINEKIMRLM